MKSTVRKELDALVCILRNRNLPDPDPVDHVPCCDAYAVFGYEACTCWEPVFDLEQQAPRIEQVPGTRERLCGDCAFRPGSPERTDHELAASDSGDLLRIVANPEMAFWCHQGMRQIIGHRHPNGMYATHVASDLGVTPYQPQIIDGIPYQADGTPGLHCAGLVAARKAKEWLP